MRQQHFTINYEHNATRCEICHQKDLFDASINQCARCCEIAATMPLIIKENDMLPIWVEIIEDLSTLQTGVFLLLGGIITGLIIDIPHYNAGVGSAMALTISSMAAVPLATKDADQFHPMISGLLFTLLVAPLGWLLLMFVTWLSANLV